MSDILILASMDLTPVFAQTQGQEENSLESQMLLKSLFNGFKWSLCQLVEHQGQVPGGEPLLTFGSVSVEIIQETSEILIIADIYG